MTDHVGGGPENGPDSTPRAQVGHVVWRHAAAAAYVESPERVLVLDLEHLDLSPYVFEGTAAEVWMCVDGDRTETDIVTDLAAAYDVPVDLVTPDVRNFIDRLRDLGLIVADGCT